ncbi:MAG TPA: macro domain-containing protein [Thermoanaerobaculia bacterium]|nr:macro domain-containing protein [Thermoanaerobaculia bacterium]
MPKKVATTPAPPPPPAQAVADDGGAKVAPAGNRLVMPLERTTLEMVQADITDLDVDVIVNAANEHLQLGSGVAGAILAKGGPSIQEECNRIGSTPVGTAVMTGAGHLKAKQVIHAVGPRMGDGDEDKRLASAVRAALALADRRGMKSIALPAISTGVFGFPVERAARVMLTEIQRFLQGGTKLERVVLCLFDEAAFNVFKKELRRGFR